MAGKRSLTFGIELECIVPESVFEDALLPRPRSHLNPDSLWSYGFPLWDIGTDGSLSGDDSDESGVEIVSKPLRANKEGLNEVARMLRFLRGLGAYTNGSCGGHVHIGIRSLYGDNARLSDIQDFCANLVEIVARVENGIWAYSGRMARAENEYCQPMKSKIHPVSIAKKERRSAESIVYESNGGGNRYQALNLLNLLGSQMTAEFRLFAGSLDEQVVLANIQTAARICLLARYGNPADIPLIASVDSNGLAMLQRAIFGKRKANPLANVRPTMDTGIRGTFESDSCYRYLVRYVETEREMQAEQSADEKRWFEDRQAGTWREVVYFAGEELARTLLEKTREAFNVSPYDSYLENHLKPIILSALFESDLKGEN